MFKRILFIIGLHIAGVLFILYAVFIGIKCPVFETTGFYCPGCGSTRMVRALIHLQFYQAFRYNPVIFISAPFVFVLVYAVVIYYILGKPVPSVIDNTLICYGFILVIFAVVRNIPTFNFLEPTVVSVLPSYFSYFV